MKILQIINSLATGGAEKLLLETIPLYRKAGIEMDVLLFWDNSQPFTKALKELNCCKVIILNQSANYKDIYSVKNIFKLRKYLRGYDIAQVHLFPAQYFVVFANILIGNKCKLIFTEHNTTNRRIQKSYLKPIEKFVYGQYEKVVCISDEIKKIYSEYIPFFKNKLVQINNGVNLNSIKESFPLNKEGLDTYITADDNLIVQISAFRLQKDQITLIKAMSFLSEKVKLVLVGDGECKEECEALAATLKLQERVLFLGLRMDVPQLLKTADIVVLSSKYEGLSLSSIEGMASGKPFIASAVPGLREVVNGAGVLFEQGNAKELATKIQALLDDPVLYEKVAQACQERAQHYDISVMVQKHIALYKSVI